MKSKPFQTSGGRRLLIGGLIIAMLTIAMVAFYTYRSYQSAATDLVLKRDRQVAQLSAARLTSELANFSGLLVDLARTSALFSGNIEEQTAALEAAGPRLSVFDGGVFLLDSHGVVVATEPQRPEMMNADLSKREYYRAMLSQSSPFISDAVADGPDGGQVISISVPIQGPQGEFLGALVGFFRIGEDVSSSFYASLVRLRLGQTGSTYLFDGQARILFDNSSDRVGNFLTTRELTQISELREFGPQRTVDDAGNEIVAALAPVPNTNWTLVIEDDWKLLTSTTRRYSNIFFLSLAMGLLLPPIGVGLIARQRRFRHLIAQQEPDEARIAQIIKQSILPTALPMLPGWEVAVRSSDQNKSSREFFDAALMSDGRLMLALGKAEGPGLAASMALTKAHAIMRNAAEEHSDPQQAMGQCNRLLAASHDGSTTISTMYLVLDPSSGQFQFCSAGQAPPMIDEDLVSGASWPIGESDELGSDYSPALEGGRGILKPGQTLLMASRHALETEGPKGEVFVDEVLLDILRQPPDSLNRLATLLMSEYVAFVSNLSHAAPELTLILLQRLPEDGTNGAIT